MTKSPSAWTKGGGRCTTRAGARSALTNRRWKTGCSTSTSSCGASWNSPRRTGFTLVAAAMIYRTLISTADLARHLDDPRWVIVDCRHNLADVDAGERAYLQAHISRARFMHMDRDLSGVKTGRNGRHPLP